MPLPLQPIPKINNKNQNQQQNQGRLHRGLDTPLGEQFLGFFELPPSRRAEATTSAIHEVGKHAHPRSRAFGRDPLRGQRPRDGRCAFVEQPLGWESRHSL